MDKKAGRDTAHFKMKPNPGSPPGMERDGHGRAIPLAERTEEDQRKAMAAGGSEASDKDPEGEAESPGAMPANQQGQGGKPVHHDREGQQGGTGGGGREQD